MTFQSLSEQLQQSVTPFVVSIQAKECAALKHLMQRVLERLMGTGVSVDVEDEPEQHSTNVNQKRVHCSLGTLCDRYKSVTQNSDFNVSIAFPLCLKVILTPLFPFKPSGKVLQVLVSIFLFHDFSVRNFIKGLLLSLLEHFHSQPLSVLCCKEEALGHATGLSRRDVERIQQLRSFMRMMAKDELVAALQNLKPGKTKKMRAALLQLEDLLAKFDQPDNVAAAEGAAGEDISSPGKGLQKKTGLFQLQKSLYEVCYYSSSAVLRPHLNATPRTAIQTALSNPYHYLKNENLRTEDGTVSNAAPDICIVYKLHLELVSAAEDKDADFAYYGKVDELKH
ncbi:unnamed protein product, partial [Coregonus sp. 'balchen']